MDPSDEWDSMPDARFLEADDLLESIEMETDDLMGLLTYLSPLNRVNDDDMIANATSPMLTVESPHYPLSNSLASDGDGFDSFDDSVWHFSSGIASAPSCSSKRATGSAKCKRPRRTDSNRARDERRRELLNLRQSVTQLEQELSTLQLEKGSVLVPREPSVERRVVPGHVTGAWETIAEHQRRDRRRAEEENVRLRVELDAQLQFAARLERLVRQSLRQRGMDEAHAGNGLQAYIDPSQYSDRSVYDALMRALEHRYQHVDALFGRLGINDIEYSHHGNRVYRRESGVEIEVFHNEVLPVSMEIAGDVVWNHYAHYMAHVPHRHYYERTREVVYANEDTLLENIGIKLNFNGTSAHVREQQVLRRFAEADRIVIMWCSNFHTIEYSERSTAGMIFRRNGCMLFKRPTTLDPNELSILKTSNMTTPMLDGAQFNPGGALTKELTDFLLSEGAASAASMHQMIENMLIHEAMRCKQPQLGIS
ncbi:hypothetical protein Poli38472_000485 [Pythium oligandrum]|uniref:M96 mating-specific protein family n=1 Tax=Pythium oligandrum TaxID=41045 RepID=A0A8K1CD64_PYTOL|nr:hypothetical protein Poli38472_000485 [Pythium oligandrum]|eukprot:TMW60443.1 hypothetical protein Poli38472_000485 [Pythium oligandrum]